MSEYQYYEFAAIDGPIPDEGLRYARGCSSRANVSRVRWQNTYTFGDFHGSVDTLLKYYDAHFRALFLGWLADFDPDEWREPEEGAVDMPPIPAGLDHLGPALAALIKHFPVDPDALAVAAGLSQAGTPDRIPMAAVLERLSLSEMRALLSRVAEGGGSGVMTELNRMTYPRVEIRAGQAMRCTDFAAKTIETREVRNRKEAKAAAAKRKREAEQRKQHLASVMQRADTLWSGLDPLMDQKIASAYDQTATQLQELRDAYAQAGDIGGFQQKLNGFRLRYSNRPAMLRRIEKL